MVGWKTTKPFLLAFGNLSGAFAVKLLNFKEGYFKDPLESTSVRENSGNPGILWNPLVSESRPLARAAVKKKKQTSDFKTLPESW